MSLNLNSSFLLSLSSVSGIFGLRRSSAASLSGSLSLLRAHGQSGVGLRIVVWVNFSDLIKSGHTQGLFEVLECAFRFGILFVEEVIKNVLIALNETLGILLTMFELLVTITLDTFEESSEGKLLLMTKFGFFLLNNGLHLNIFETTIRIFDRI